MLFGAVAIVGTLGAVTVSTMRGPLSTMVEVQSRAKAESEMAIASRLSMLEAIEAADNGDCDGDGFVEPLEYETGGGPTGGGLLPASVSSSRFDPWGTEYGYCVWDSGPVVNDAVNCDNNGTAGLQILDGNGLGTGANAKNYTVIAIVAAGPDQVFQTTCTEGPPSLNKGGDDIIVEFTYDSAAAATDGLWDLIDPDTAAISKDLEVTGGASFTDGIDLTSSSSALTLGAASMLFPTEATLINCDPANEGLVRLNTSTTPDTLEVCDEGGNWENVGAGGSIWSYVSASTDEIYFNTAGTTQVGIGKNNPASTLDVAGTLAVSGAVDFASTLDVTGLTTLADLDASTLDTTGAVTIGSTLNVTSMSTLEDVTAENVNVITLTASTGVSTDALSATGASNLATLNATGAVDFDSTLNVDGATTLVGAIDAQGDISNSGGDVTLDDNVTITGDLDVQGTLTGVDGDFSAGELSASDYTWNGNDFTPSTCASGNFNRWDGNSWVCESDTVGSGGGGSSSLNALSDVDITSPVDGSCLTYDNGSGDWIDTPCSATTTAGIWEVVGDTVRTKSSALDRTIADFVFGSNELDDGDELTRMFFDKSKAAFRAGRGDAGSWNSSQVGDYSFAGGLNTRAIGQGSTAFGQGNYAIGDYSFTAGGTNNIAGGNTSIAIGSGAEATGYASTSIGTYNTATGHLSIALGTNVIVGDDQIDSDIFANVGDSTNPDVGEGSMAIGLGTLAELGPIVGNRPRVTGDGSFAIFMGAHAGYDLTADKRMALIGGDFMIDDDGTAGDRKSVV